MTDAEEEIFDYFVTLKGDEDAGIPSQTIKSSFTLREMGMDPFLWRVLTKHTREKVLRDFCYDHAKLHFSVEWQQRT